MYIYYSLTKSSTGQSHLEGGFRDPNRQSQSMSKSFTEGKFKDLISQSSLSKLLSG